MYQTHRIYIQEDMLLPNLVEDNPSLLLLLEFFDLQEAIPNVSIAEVCAQKGIKLKQFLMFANLYNGFFPHASEVKSESIDISSTIKFLKRSHQYYIHEKCPEIQDYIKQLYKNQDKGGIQAIEQFFTSYFDEVLEHLRYEDEIAFPYFCQLYGEKKGQFTVNFSVNDYRDHHTDIETKLSDLKNLLIKHIALKGDFSLRRKMIKSLFELENELEIHALIEEFILLPLVEDLENRRSI